MTPRLPTAIEVLDERLEGGIIAGSVVVLSADPSSQAELFLAELTTARETRYLTTKRSKRAVETFLDRTTADVENCTVVAVDDEEPIEHSLRLVRSLPPETNLVIDPLDVLEDNSGPEPRFRAFMNEVKDAVYDARGLAVFYCLDGQRVPKLRDTTEHMADVVFELQTTIAGDAIENRLFVPKVRGGRALNDVIKLDLTNRVTVDTSRDIA